jgi:hypothetical protein
MSSKTVNNSFDDIFDDEINDETATNSNQTNSNSNPLYGFAGVKELVEGFKTAVAPQVANLALEEMHKEAVNLLYDNPEVADAIKQQFSQENLGNLAFFSTSSFRTPALKASAKN